MWRSLLLMASLLGCHAVANAQTEVTPYQNLSLANLSEFQSTSPNWQVVGSVRAGRDEKSDFAVSPGNGILANVQSETDRGHLFSGWNHADLELDLEVMMPKGSNSGIYFQSRYEIQLLDSWGVKEPRQSDIGGIYQRWDGSRPEGEKGYEGHPPAVNVARAPGLWQHLNVVFQAPRFDASGKKVSQAKFVRVMLNGIVIHEEVALTGPTRSAADEDSEVAEAPLMIQGDHGPVAFRNIRYRKFDADPVRLSNLSYNYYRGDFPNQMPALDDLVLVRSEKTESITAEKADTTKLFALRFEGDLEVPRTGMYTLEIVHSARFKLELDGQEILNDQQGDDVSKVGEFPRRFVQHRLRKGNHAFALTYAKGLWHNVPTALGWYISGPGLLRTQLTASGSVPKDAFSAYKLKVTNEPIVQRNFVVHGDDKRTHAMSVGFPDGLHYSYDMGSGALLHVWKGSFVDTSTMWYQRGNMQSAVPLGSLVTRSGKPSIYVGDTDSWDSAAFIFKNYRLDGAGRPTYQYEVNGITVVDDIKPNQEHTHFSRTLTLKGDPGGNTVWCLLAESENIEAQSDGEYLIDDQRMYISTGDLQGVQINEVEGKMQLLAPVEFEGNQASISYHLVW